ncbi:MAG: biopolymer transporter ExbD [Pedobacter sp.]|nr:MAG: biopolymer transporter ExbD [Pedobacter sp.]
MADISTTTQAKSHAGFSKKRPKHSTRVDLTPMVDLGFLLITFFVFTTTMSEAKAMKMMMPNDKDSTTSDLICETCALTVVLGKNNSIWYYEGMEGNADYKQTDYTAAGLRKIIMDKKRSVKEIMHADKMVLIIKPAATSTFKNLVNTIDESTINMVQRYYLDELSAADKLYVQ